MAQTGLVRTPEILPAQTQEELRGKAPASDVNDGSLESLRVLWDSRRTLGKILAAGAAGGLALAFLLPARYQSSVQLMPPDSQQGMSMQLPAAMSQRAGNGLGMMASDALGVKTTGALFVGVLRSRTVEDRLVNKFSLKEVYGVRLTEQARRVLHNNTDISEDRKSGIISISVSDGNAKRATLLAQANVDELNHLVVELSTSSAHRERVFLEERLVTIKENLDRASREFSEFASKNGAIDIKEQGRALVESSALLQGQWIAAESELHGLQAIYTANNVRVRTLQARVAELRQQVEKMNGTERAEITGGGQSSADYPSLRTLPLLGVTYTDLYRRTRIDEAVYERLTQQYELAKVEEAKQTPSVIILDSASVPEQKVFPPRLMVICLSTTIAFLAGVGGVMARNEWRRIAMDNPRKRFALEVLHSVKSSAAWWPLQGASWHHPVRRAWKRVFRGTTAEN